LRPLAEAELARRAKADSIGGGQESVTGSGIFSEGERYVIGR
jgi:hypothetical protein